VETEDATQLDGRMAQLDVIAGRVAWLKQESMLIVQRARDASTRARENRAQPATVCTHLEEVAQMQCVLADLERELEGLRAALATRGVIEQAKGMLMLQRHCDAEEAFEVLVRLSQKSGKKLVDVARTVVTTWMAADDAKA